MLTDCNQMLTDCNLNLVSMAYCLSQNRYVFLHKSIFSKGFNLNCLDKNGLLCFIINVSVPNL